MKFVAIVFMFISAVSSSACATYASESMAIATITGTVSDATSSRPIANAEVSFINNSEKMLVKSASDGTFSLTLPAGTYRLIVHIKGYDDVTREIVTVNDLPVNIQVALSASGALKTIANVSVKTQSTINVTPAAISTITAQQIAAQGSIGLSRVLSEIPGVQISMTSVGSNNQTAYEYAINSPADPVYIGIRGSAVGESATLFDGHRLNSNTNIPGDQAGAFNLADIDTQSISAIDIVKGPGADSPTVNNAIGGVANINPGLPSGPPSAHLSYGFDGSGGLQLNMIAQGETKNKRFALGVSAESYTLSGPINGWSQFSVSCSAFFLSLLNGGPNFLAPNPPTYNPYQYPHLTNIDGLGSLSNNTSNGCCLNKFTRDTTSIQQRWVTLLYNITPKLQFITRYGLNNSISNYVSTPLEQGFSSPAGYQGKYPNGYQFFSPQGIHVAGPAREIDQTYEWDIHAQIGKGSARLSYLSYNSTNVTDQGFNTNVVCSNCTISGEANVCTGIVGFVPSGCVPTIFNDQRVTLTPCCIAQTNAYATSLTHDIVADFLYPLVNETTIGLSYNSTVSSATSNFAYNCVGLPATGSPGFAQNSPSGGGEFERFNTLHASVRGNLTKNLSAQISLYANQYEYHIPNPAPAASPTDFQNFFSYATMPRFGFEWRPRQDIAVRASAGGGIAPVDFSNLVGQNEIPTPNVAPPGIPSYYTVNLANPNLKAETSFGEDLGASLRMGHVSTLSVDIYNTTLHGQFFSNYQPDGTYQRLPLFSTQTRNLAHSKYQGIEITYDRQPPVGVFFTVQGSLQRAFPYDLPANFYATAGGPYCTNLSLVQNSNFNGGPNGIGKVAYAQGYAAIGWKSLRGFQTSANFTYYGNNNGFARPAFVTIDLNGSIPLNNRVSISIALANLTNIYPALYYQPGVNSSAYSVIPYAHAQTGTGDIGLANGVQNVGPRHLSATLDIRL